jgi:hypothetical protein
MLEWKEQLKQTRELTRLISAFDLDLALAENDREVNISGNFIYVLHAPNENSYISIKLNELSAPPIKLYRQMGIQAPHERIFMTLPASQAGTMNILHGFRDPAIFAIIDNRSATIEGIGAIRDELQGDTTPETWKTEKTVEATPVEILPANVNRKACIIQSKGTNAGLVYLGFDDTVATNKWIAELAAGQAFCVDDYRGPIWGRGSAAAQLVGYGEW